MKSISNNESIGSVIPLLLIIGKADGFIEEKKNKYLAFDSTDENKKVLKKYTEPLDGILKK